MESHDAADEVMKAFQQYTTKPVVALIYTHFHHDHVGGSHAYLKYTQNNRFEVYSHQLTSDILTKFMDKTGTIGQIRGARQFGNYLQSNEFINSGIGPCLQFHSDCELSIVYPTITFEKSLEVIIEGVKLHLHHCPGETDDQIVVHLPELSVLCAADNIYRAFPNLYAIRGTPTRDAYVWAQSLQFMASLQPNYLVPSHTRPVTGIEEIRGILEVYRDAILFVHDQTVRYMNKGYFLDDIISRVNLPDHLYNHPFLQEFYGTVEWSVRGVFNTYLGWFGGDPSDLHPHSPPEYSQRLIQLSGGVKNLLKSAEIAFEENDPQWSLHCSQAILRWWNSNNLNSNNNNNNNNNEFDESIYSNAYQLTISSLRSLATREISANGRNYYLTYARELEGTINIKPGPKQVREVVKQLGAIQTLKLLPLRLRAEQCEDVEMKVIYRFPDLEKAVKIIINKGISRVVDEDYHELETKVDSDLLVTVNSQIFEEIAANLRNKTTTILTGDMIVTGKGISSSLILKKFMDYFEDSKMEDKVPI